MRQTDMHGLHVWREECGIPKIRVRCDIGISAPHNRKPNMTLLAALALLPVAAGVHVSLVIALAKTFDTGAEHADAAGTVPTLA